MKWLAVDKWRYLIEHNKSNKKMSQNQIVTSIIPRKLENHSDDAWYLEQ